jgi:hypothetical protein
MSKNLKKYTETKHSRVKGMKNIDKNSAYYNIPIIFLQPSMACQTIDNTSVSIFFFIKAEQLSFKIAGNPAKESCLWLLLLLNYQKRKQISLYG